MGKARRPWSLRVGIALLFVSVVVSARAVCSAGQAISLPLPTTPADVTYVTSIGGGPLEGHFNGPQGIAIDRAGRVYVVDTGYARVQVFDSEGRFLRMWGTPGTGPGQFRRPWRVALDAADNVYVTDLGNHRVQVFANDGRFLRAWGAQGFGVGQLSFPSGVAVGPDGNVYVTDRQHRLQVFTADGAFVRAWGSRGAGEGQFTATSVADTGPEGVAIDHQGQGQVYVADSWSHRVQVFTLDGSFLRAFGRVANTDRQFYGTSAIALGRQDGSLNTPAGIAFDSAGAVLVVSSGRTTTIRGVSVQKFTATGEFLQRWGEDGYGPGQFANLEDIAVDGAGNVYVTDNGNNRVQKFNSAGVFLKQWGSIGDGLLRGPSDLAFDRANNLYVLDSRNSRLQKFDSNGRFLTAWGAPKGRWALVENGQFMFPLRIAVDGEDRVYVTDVILRQVTPGTPRIAPVQMFTPDGAWLGLWRPKKAASEAFVAPVAFDASGNVYADDVKRVRKFTAAGDPLPFPRNTARDVAIDANGNVYMAEWIKDRDLRRLRVFSPQGRELVRSDPFPVHRHSRGPIAVDSAGRVFVAGMCQVLVLNARGTRLGQFGVCGFGPGDFDEIQGIAVDATGQVFISDYLNNRVQVFHVRSRDVHTRR